MQVNLLKHHLACTQGLPRASVRPWPAFPLDSVRFDFHAYCLGSALAWPGQKPPPSGPFQQIVHQRIIKDQKEYAGKLMVQETTLMMNGIHRKNIPISLPLGWASSEACFSLSPQGVQRNYMSDALSNQLLNTSWLDFLPFLARFPDFPPGIFWDHFLHSKSRIIVSQLSWVPCKNGPNSSSLPLAKPLQRAFTSPHVGLVAAFGQWNVMGGQHASSELGLQ